MKCYYVLVHGQFQWHDPTPARTDDTDVFRPEGFYCHRYVLASTPQAAQAIAFERVRRNLDTQAWFTEHAVTLDLEADEVENAPIYKLLKPENRGHTFYSED